jgi:hypothetical protein
MLLTSDQFMHIWTGGMVNKPKASNYILVGDPRNFISYCHAVHHISTANLTNLFVKAGPKACP